MLAGGIWLSFTRLDSHLAPLPVQAARLLVFDFCRAGRRAIPDGPEEYAIVTEAHAAVSFAAPDEPCRAASMRGCSFSSTRTPCRRTAF